MGGERLSGSEGEQGVIGPDGLLLAAIFGEEGATSIPSEFESARREAVHEVLQTISPSEREALDLRFGISEGSSRTLEKVGYELGIRFRGEPYGRENARRILAKALRKLRHPSRSDHLRPFLPLPEESVGRVMLNLRFGCEFTKQFPNVATGDLFLSDLDFPERIFDELTAKITFHSYFSSNSIASLMRFLRSHVRAEPSEEACLDFRQALERLEENKAKIIGRS